jgi:serine acetyltransferase
MMHIRDRPSFVHSAALVETEQIGVGTSVWAFTHILNGAIIGSRCNIGGQCFIEGGARIGNAVTIKNGCSVWDGVSLEDEVFVGPAVVFTNDRRPRSRAMAPSRYSTRRWISPTVVKRGATLGAGAIIVAGSTIGEFAFVAAGTVVTGNVPPYALVVGVPGRAAGWVCECAEAISFVRSRARCDACGKTYARAANSVHRS